MTERFHIIHLGNPYDFVVKDHTSNKTYGTFQGDSVALKECFKDIEKEMDELKQENQQYKSILQDMGLLISGDDEITIRNTFADKIIKPIFAESGFDVDVDTSNGFAISLKEEKE